MAEGIMTTNIYELNWRRGRNRNHPLNNSWKGATNCYHQTEKNLPARRGNNTSINCRGEKGIINATNVEKIWVGGGGH